MVSLLPRHAPASKVLPCPAKSVTYVLPPPSICAICGQTRERTSLPKWTLRRIVYKIYAMKVCTSADARRLDQAVILDYGIDQALLMENAAIAARRTIERRWGVKNKTILIACGMGSNGGDGFALARLLHAKGAGVSVLTAGDTGRLSGSSKSNYKSILHLPIKIWNLGKSPETAIPSGLDFSRFNLIVDAIFGTGLSRSIDGSIAALIAGINASGTPVLAMDIPSGIGADTGEVLGSAIKADASVCFGMLKRGNLLYPGHQYGGSLYFSEISFPPEVTEDDSVHLTLNIPPPLSMRNPAGHKGFFGKVFIIGGSMQYRGAPTLAAFAALRTGAGYAFLAIPAAIAGPVFSLIPEAVLLPLSGSGILMSDHTSTILDRASRADATVLGPGLGASLESTHLVRNLIQEVQGPLVLDGDGLIALAGKEELSRNREFPTILTPHPGEMARLLGSSIGEVEIRRVETAAEAAERYQAIVVLKGAHSIISLPSGQSWINLSGNCGMGTAGSGDVLAGIIGALIAGGGKPEDAVRQGVYIHGLAGDISAGIKGEGGMLARDIVECIPEALRILPEQLAKNPDCDKITYI